MTSAFEAAENKVRSSLDPVGAGLPLTTGAEINLDSLLSKAEQSQEGNAKYRQQTSDVLLVEENGPSDDTLCDQSSNLLLGPQVDAP